MYFIIDVDNLNCNLINDSRIYIQINMNSTCNFKRSYLTPQHLIMESMAVIPSTRSVFVRHT